MTTTETYLPTATYDALTEALRSLRADPLTGKIERHQIVELLGEVTNVWPVTVLDGAGFCAGPGEPQNRGLELLVKGLR